MDALSFGPADVVDVLPALVSLAEATVRARIGDSVRHLGWVVELALELVARGRLLPAAFPATAQRRRLHEARWLPVLGEGDKDRIRSLIAGVPPICLAGVAPRQAGRPGPPGPAVAADRALAPQARIVRELLESAVDATARRALAGRSLLPVRRGRRPAVPSSAT
ncbi:MAG: hypothetical protein ACRDZQ_07720, partial [Acidimicrobiales bacterium]